MSTAALDGVVGYLRRLGERSLCALADGQLLDRFNRDQDEGAYAELVRRHGPMVLAVCRRVLHHEHDAEDAFQAAFLVLVRKAGSIRQGQSLGGWLFQMAHRLAVRARLGGQRRHTIPLDELAVEPAAPTPVVLSAALDEELERLPEQYRSAVVLCYLQGQTQAEAARKLATTAEAINSRLKRARDILRQRLAVRGVAVSGAALTAALLAQPAVAVAPGLVHTTTRIALEYAANPAACGASALALTLANGALNMTSTMNKILCVVALAAGLFAAASLVLPLPVLGDDPAQTVA